MVLDPDPEAVGYGTVSRPGLQLPNSLHTCIVVLAHHPKKGEKQGPAVEPGVVRISNRVFWMSGYGDCLAEGAG